MIETPCHATHSRHSSASTTDDSSPVTPTFSARTQSRYSSTNSSAASLPPPHHEALDLNPAHRKNMPVLPNLVEDPMEREIPSDDVFAGEPPLSPLLPATAWLIVPVSSLFLQLEPKPRQLGSGRFLRFSHRI